MAGKGSGIYIWAGTGTAGGDTYKEPGKLYLGIPVGTIGFDQNGASTGNVYFWSGSAWESTGQKIGNYLSGSGDGTSFMPSNYSGILIATITSQAEPLATGAHKIPVISAHAVTTDHFIVAFARTEVEAKAIVDAGEGHPIFGATPIAPLLNKFSDAPSFMAFKRVSAADQNFYLPQGT